MCLPLYFLPQISECSFGRLSRAPLVVAERSLRNLFALLRTECAKTAQCGPLLNCSQTDRGSATAIVRAILRRIHASCRTRSSHQSLRKQGGRERLEPVDRSRPDVRAAGAERC